MENLYWERNEVVDGAGLPLAAHAQQIALKLNLSEEQRALLVAELRNALVPARTSPNAKRVGRALERVLALADAIAKGSS